MKNITVLLVDDHTVVRQGLRALLSQEEDITVVGEAENGRQAVQIAERVSPDVVLMDVVMPLMNGLEGTRQMLKFVPSAKVLVLSAYGDDDYVQQLTEAGASGYLTKQTAAEELLLAMREVHRGNAFFSPAIAKRLRDRCRQTFDQGLPIKRSVQLTSRESEVLQLIAEGLPNRQIAGELGISTLTVQKHRNEVMKKLNIHDVAGLTRYAISKGVVERELPGPLSSQPIVVNTPSQPSSVPKTAKAIPSAASPRIEPSSNIVEQAVAKELPVDPKISKGKANPTRILIVDDHPLLRMGISQLINQEMDMIMVGEAEDAQKAITAIENTRPDVALIDISLKGSSGIELLKDIKVRFPKLKTMVPTDLPHTLGRSSSFVL
jgi:DNA-binding NarL/FixJ family response regulator